MRNLLLIPALLLALPLTAVSPFALAQATAPADEDNSSQGVEESDEAFRRRMELEDARNRAPGYTVPSSSSSKALEKIDKLPEASRDNIREQLVDIIVENGEWEPFDALREYPYEPTAAAQAEPRLMQQEQEAWDEQIQKYHEREAAAYGARRGPVPGPGNPTGAEGSEGSGDQDGEQDGEQGGDQEGDQGGEQGASGQSGEQSGDGESGQAGSAGTYQPYDPNHSASEDGASTAGTQQSALDFLRGHQGQASAAPSAAAANASAAPSADAAAAPGVEAAAEADAESEPSPDAEVILDTRGIIAIEDLDKLEGAEAPQEPGDSERR